jgi:hypothetical protein
VATHDAVGVEHDHAFVVGAPAPHEVGDVARLAFAAVAAAAVEHPLRAEALAEALPQRLFVGRDALVGGVRKHEEIERPLLALERERGPGRRESRPDAHGVLVVDRHHDRSAAPQRAPGELGHVERLRIAASQLHAKARYRGPQRARDPGEEPEEQHEADDLDPGHAVRLEDIEQQSSRRRGGEQRQPEEQRAPQAHLPGRARRAHGLH